MDYYCECCNYSSNNLSNFNKHKKTNVHIKKNASIVKNPHNNHKKSTQITQKSTYICEYCKKEYSRHDSLKRHQETCKFKKSIVDTNIIIEHNKQLVEEVNELRNKINQLEKEKLEMKIEMLETMHNDDKDDKKYFKDLVVGAGNLAQTSVNALTFVGNNFKSVPAIEAFNDFKLIIPSNKF